MGGVVDRRQHRHKGRHPHPPPHAGYNWDGLGRQGARGASVGPLGVGGGGWR
jgi:hypothetical protein